MGNRKLARFFRRPDALATPLKRRGLFSFRALRVPAGWFGYVVDDERLGGRMVSPGAPLKPARGFPAWLLRSTPWDLTFRFSKLKSREGMEFDLYLTLTVTLEPRPTTVKLFLGSLARRHAESRPQALLVGDLAADLEPRLRNTFACRIEALTAEEAAGELDTRRARELLRESGEETLFERGLDLSQILVRAECPEFEGLRRRELDLELEEERVERRLRFVELWKRQELEAARARQEVASVREGSAVTGPAAGAGEAAPEVESPEATGSKRLGDWITTRVLICAGKQIYELSPERDEAPTVVADLSGGDLGYLRSVRLVFADDERSAVLLAGAQRGLYAQERGATLASTGEPEAYRFPVAADGGGGTNAALLDKGYVYATHSEVGLVSWPRYAPHSATILYSAQDHGARSVRGLQSSTDGEIVFVAGDHLFSFDDRRGSRELRPWATAGSEITSLAASWEHVVAGTADGRLLLFEHRDTPPRELARLGPHAIYAVRPVVVEGKVYYVVGSRSSFVYVRDADGTSELSFRATRPVRWVDAASDFIFGVDQSGRRLYLWKWDDRENPARDFLLPEKIRDLWIPRVI